MAHFLSDRFPSLVVAGVGKFVNGNLEADGEDADVVRKLAKKLEIQEVNSPPEDPDGNGDPAKGDPAKGDGGKVLVGEHGPETVNRTDGDGAPDGDPAEMDPPEPKSNAKRAEVEEWAVAHGFDVDEDLKGKNIPEIREAVRAKHAK